MTAVQTLSIIRGLGIPVVVAQEVSGVKRATVLTDQRTWLAVDPRVRIAFSGLAREIASVIQEWDFDGSGTTPSECLMWSRKALYELAEWRANRLGWRWL